MTIGVVLAIFVVSASGCMKNWRIDCSDGNAYSLRVWLRVESEAYSPYFSSFSINQDIDELAATLASKKDQHKNPLKTEVFQDAYILITQEASDDQFNYYLILYCVDTTYYKHGYFYALYLPKVHFITADSICSIAMPYHLLGGVEIQNYSLKNTISGSSITNQLAATPDDIYNFYDSISTCTIEKHQDGAFIVEDKTSGNRFKITINESDGTPNITFEVLS